MAVSIVTSPPYPFESENRRKALDLTKSKKNHSQLTSGIPSQEVIEYFKSSLNNLAFQSCRRDTPAMLAIYQKVWKYMGAPTESSHPEIAHPRFGEHAMWDIYPRFAPNYIKIKAIDSYHCSQARKQLRAIAEAFQSGKTARALQLSRTLKHSCTKVEILNNLPESIYQRLWELMGNPVHRTHPKIAHKKFGELIYWDRHPKTKASPEVRAQAVADCILRCKACSDEEYVGMVEKPTPIEFSLQKALYAFKTPKGDPIKYCSEAIGRSTHAERGLIRHLSDFDEEMGIYAFNPDESSAIREHGSQGRIYAIEAYLKELAILKMGCIAEAFQKGKGDLAVAWSIEFFSVAKSVRVYKNLS